MVGQRRKRRPVSIAYLASASALACGPRQDTARSVGVSVLDESRPVDDLSGLFMLIGNLSLTFLSFKN